MIGEASQPSVRQPGYVFGASKATGAPDVPVNPRCKACRWRHDEPMVEAAKLTAYLTCCSACGGGDVRRRLARKLFLLAFLYLAATSPKTGKIVTLRG